MNHSFRTVWNRARGALVAVNEETSSYKQGAGSTRGGEEAHLPDKESTSSIETLGTSLRRTLMAGAVTALFFSASGAFAAVTLPSGCASAGGTLKNGVCTFSAPTKPGTAGSDTSGDGAMDLLNVAKDHFASAVTVNSGNVVFQGGASDYTAPYFTLSGMTSGQNFTFKSTGTLSFLGGTGKTAFGIAYISAVNSDGSTALAGNSTLSNSSTGTILIQGGSGASSNGIGAISRENTGTLVNGGSGSIKIQGGSGANAHGIGQMTTMAGSSATIRNLAGGTMIIQGGSGGSGIRLGASGSRGDTVVTIQNAGTMTIAGGSGGFGLGTLKAGSSQGSIYNDGGTLTVSPGDSTSYDFMGIESLAVGSGGLGNLTNANGTVIVQGGANADTTAIKVLAGNAGNATLIQTAQRGTTTFQGGDANLSLALLAAASDEGAVAKIENAAGTMEFIGGTGSSSYGLQYLAVNNGTAMIENTGPGTIHIQGGSGDGAFGIYRLAVSGGTGSITNSSTGSILFEGGSGTLSDGLYFFGEDTAAQLLNTGAGNVTIQGSSTAGGGFGINTLAYFTGAAIKNSGTGTLSFLGKAQSGLQAVAQNGSKGTIQVTNGSLVVTGGGTAQAHGIKFNGYGGGTGGISIEGSATAVFSSEGAKSYGVYINAVGDNSIGSIAATGSQPLVINGGGIWGNSAWSNNMTAGATGTISAASGLTINGGAAAGLSANAYGNNAASALSSPIVGKINVTGGDLTITGGSVPGIISNAEREGQGTITYTGTGNVTIQGGWDIKAMGIFNNALADADTFLGVGLIQTSGAKTLIQGGKDHHAHGIGFNARFGDTNATKVYAVDQRIQGTLKLESDEVVIQGSTNSLAYGIFKNAQGYGAEGLIEVTKGNLHVLGSADSYGIYANADGMGIQINNRSALGKIIFSSGSGKTAVFDTGSIYINAVNGGVGIIENTSDGTIVLKESAIWVNSTNKGVGRIINSGAGDILIENGAIGSNAHDYFSSKYPKVGGTGYIENSGAGTITFRGGNLGAVQTNGSGSSTDDDPAVGWIINSGEGRMIFDASAGHVVKTNAGGTGIGHIVNRSSTQEMTLQGSGANYVVYDNAIGGVLLSKAQGYITNSGKSMTLGENAVYEVAGNGGLGVINNSDDGVLSFLPGAVYCLASGSGKASIVNEGAGQINIASDSINLFSVDGGTSHIRNLDAGTISIAGLPILTNDAKFGEAVISNEGSGTIEIKADATTAIAALVRNTGWVTVQNTGSGIFNVIGGTTSSAYGIDRLAAYYSTDEILKFTNSGTGTMRLTGRVGAALNVLTERESIDNGAGSTMELTAGAEGGAAINTVKNAINNAGTLIVTGTDAGYAIGDATSGFLNNSGTAYLNGRAYNKLGNVSNAQGAKMYIGATASSADNFGCVDGFEPCGGTISKGEPTESPDGFAVQTLFGTLANAGDLYLTDKGIYTVGAFQNTATGNVYATSGAFYYASGSTTSKQELPITLFNPEAPEDGTKEDVTIAGYEATITTTGTWALKSKWTDATVKWTDGGSLTITDIKAGSAAAQQMTTAFQNAWGTGTTLNFTGDNAGEDGSTSVSDKPDFTLVHVNSLITAGSLTEGRVIGSEYLTMGGSSLTLGTDGDIALTTGFKGVKGASGVTVKDAKKLYVLGETAGLDMTSAPATSRAKTDIVDSNVELQSGTLVLGAANYKATEGVLKNVTADSASKVDVQNGFYTVAALNSAGTVSVGEKASFVSTEGGTIKNLKNSGRFTAEKKLTITSGKRTATTTLSALAAEAAASSSSGEDRALWNAKGATMTLADVDVAEGGMLVNQGTLTAGDINVGATGQFINAKDASLTATNITARGAFINGGDITVTDTMTASAALLSSGKWRVNTLRFAAAPALASKFEPSVVSTEAYVNTVDLEGGEVVVKKGGVLAGKELKGGEVKSVVRIEEGGKVGFAHDGTSLKEAADFFKGDLSSKAVLALTKDMTFAEGGRLVVGNVKNETGTVNLGENALLMLSTKQLHGAPLLSGKADQALHAEEGATIQITDSALMGRHYIMSGFDRTSSDEVVKVGVLDKYGRPLQIKSNDKGVYISIGADSAAELGPDYAFKTAIDAVLDGMQDLSSDHGDIGFLSNTILSELTQGAAESQKVERLATEAGVFAETTRLGVAANSLMLTHALEDRTTGSAFWAAGLYSKTDSGAVSTSSGTSFGYDVDVTGFAFGLDAAKGGWNFGAAFSAQRGDLDANASALKSDIDAYGFSVYGGRTFSDSSRLMGSITYVAASHEITQNALGAVKGDTDARAVVLGVRGETILSADAFSFTPYVAVEVVRTFADDFTATWSGKDAFEYSKTNGTLWRMPVGVKTAGAFALPSLGEEAKLKLTLDASVTPQIGDRDQNFAVRAVSIGSVDHYSAETADKVLGNLKLGVGFESDRGSFTLSYGVEKGNVRDLSHSINAKASIFL